MSCYASLAYYLREKRELHSIFCPAFTDLDNIYLYRYSNWRVPYEVQTDRILVWSFTPVLNDDEQ